MSIYYLGNETQPPATPVGILPVERDDDPANYIADANLAAAVNVALILGKPLLLTGEPGTGKTRLAYHVAMALGLGEPERFDTRSSSQSVELFYRFDSLASFHAAHAKEPGRRALDYVGFGPLGKAILRTLPRNDSLFEILGLPYPDLPGSQQSSPYPGRSVVLIDEIDKAPRDFPNDLLDSIDNLRFSIRELESVLSERLIKERRSTDIVARNALRPLVIITSNSEKSLPDPFLRRCVYFHIAFPNAGQLRLIVARQLARFEKGGAALATVDAVALAAASALTPEQAQPLLRSAVEFFESVRQADLLKSPSTAELIDWVRYLLASGAGAGQALSTLPALVHRSLGTLVKRSEDLDPIRELADQVFPLPAADGRPG